MNSLAKAGPRIGLGGSLLFGAACLVTAIAYRGTAGEAFSPLNHYISELGEIGVSGLALVFNLGLIAGGAALAAFMGSLGALRRSRLAWLYVPIGVAAGLSGALVGVFPMNQIGIHRLVALGFFNFGWIAVGLASIDLWRAPDARFARWLPALGGLTVAFFIAFLAVYLPSLSYSDAGAARPDVSLETILEWLVLVGIIGWVLAASAGWWKHERGRGN